MGLSWSIVKNFGLLTESKDRYFILRAIHEIDIETSNAHSSWVSNPGVMGILNKAYNQKKGKVYLIFSVIRR